MVARTEGVAFPLDAVTVGVAILHVERAIVERGVPTMPVLGRATDHEYAHKVVVRRVGADFVVVRAGRASDGDSVAKLSLAVLIEEDVVVAAAVDRR